MQSWYANQSTPCKTRSRWSRHLLRTALGISAASVCTHSGNIAPGPPRLRHVFRHLDHQHAAGLTAFIVPEAAIDGGYDWGRVK